MALFSRARRSERDAATRIYEAALAAARRPPLYLQFGVPDTLDGRFEMVALHLFPVLSRLMEEDPAHAQLVAESLVNDMDGALRDIGVSDTRVPKRMKTLYGSFAGRLSAYGRALAEGDAPLEAAIARNVFPNGGEARHVRRLAAMLKASIAAVRGADLQELRDGAVPFPDLGPAEDRQA